MVPLPCLALCWGLFALQELRLLIFCNSVIHLFEKNDSNILSNIYDIVEFFFKDTSVFCIYFFLSDYIILYFSCEFSVYQVFLLC